MSWFEIARAQAGAISHVQLLATGVSASTVDRLLASGALWRLYRGVYLVGGAPKTELAKLWGAHLATDGVFRLATAGRLWGVYEAPPQPLYLAIPPTRHITTLPGVQIRRTALPRTAMAERAGLPTTSRRWTVLDLLGWLDHASAMRLADRAVQQRWLDRHDCEQRLAEFPKRRGNGRLRLVAGRLGDGAAANSERLLHQLLRRAGIHGWMPNYAVWARGELVAVVDVAIPGRRVAIEVDGMAYHVDTDRFQRDRSRQNALTSLGWTVLRFTWADLTQRPGYVIAMVQRLAA